jgi:hypothetical protein
MLHEWAGLQNPQANYNAIALAVVDAGGQAAGSIAGYAADELYESGPATIVTAGQHPGRTSWSFTWTAPQAGTGTVAIHLAAVDGNGAGGTVGTLTDPWGDDVFVGTLTIDDASLALRTPPGTSLVAPSLRADALPARPEGALDPVSALGAMCGVGVLRWRAGKRRTREERS